MTTDTTEPTWTTTTVSYDIDTDVVEAAVRNAVAATEPTAVGDYGTAFLVPEGFP